CGEAEYHVRSRVGGEGVGRADRLIGQPDAGFLLIGRSPGRIDRISEGRTRAGDVGRGGRRRRSRNDDAGGERIDGRPHLLPMLHGHDPPPAAPAATGRCTVNVAPCPGTLSMVSRPAWRLTTCVTDTETPP